MCFIELRLIQVMQHTNRNRHFFSPHWNQSTSGYNSRVEVNPDSAIFFYISDSPIFFFTSPDPTHVFFIYFLHLRILTFSDLGPTARSGSARRTKIDLSRRHLNEFWIGLKFWKAVNILFHLSIGFMGRFGRYLSA